MMCSKLLFLQLKNFHPETHCGVLGPLHCFSALQTGVKTFFFYYEEILTWSRGREREGQRG